MQGLWLEPGVSQGFPSAQWPSSPYWRWGWIPSCWSRSPEGRVWPGSVSLECVLLPLPAPAPFTYREQCCSKSESCVGSQLLMEHRLQQSTHKRRSTLLLMLPVPALAIAASSGLSLLCPSWSISPLSLCHPHPGVAPSIGLAGLHRLLACVRAQAVVVQLPLAQSYFWCAACVRASNGCPHPTQ